MFFTHPLGQRTEYSVTAIITTHNRTDLLKRSVCSVMRQDYDDIDLIIVDDASTDDTQRYASKLAEKYDRIRYIRISEEESNGANYARNVGIDAAEGKLIAFLDDDDEWLPEKTTLQIEFFKRHPQIKALSSDWMEVYVIDGKEYKYRMRYSYKYGNYEYLINSYMSHTSTMIMYKNVLDKIGGFLIGLPAMQETELQYRICSNFQVGFLRKPVAIAYHYIGGNHISSSLDSYFEALEIVKKVHEEKYSMLNSEQKHRLENKLIGDKAFRYLFIGDNVRYQEVEKMRLKECGKWENIKYCLSFFFGIKTIIKLFVLKNRIQEFYRYKLRNCF